MGPTATTPGTRAVESEIRRKLQVLDRAGELGPARALILCAFAAGHITPGLLSDLAALQVQAGELLAAERLLVLALELAPESVAARCNLAELLLLTHRHKLAAGLIRSVLARLPETEQKRLGPHVEMDDCPAAPRGNYRPEIAAIWQRLRGLAGVRTAGWQVDQAGFERFPCAHPWSPAPYYYEKKLQYYLSAAVLRLTREDRLVDVASQGSAFPGYAKRIVGCDVYRQDLIYPPGRARYLPGDASAMPVPDGFFTAMTLHCSFEHFEGDSDIRFIREAARVLRPGGRVCIVPLYLEAQATERYEQSIPNGAERLALGPGCEFYRGYSPESLRERILIPAAKDFQATLYQVVNLDAVAETLPPHQILNCHFLLLLERR